MTKEELLQELSIKINSGEISKGEVLGRLNLSTIASSIEAKLRIPSSFSVTKLLYVLGAIIAIAGMFLFSYQIWNDIGSIGRISITLGLGLMLTAIGSVLSRNKTEEEGDTIGTIFHFMGGLLIPGGSLVALFEFSTGMDPSWPLALTFGTIFLFYLLINYIHKNAVLTFFTIANGTAFIYLLVEAITGGLFYDYVNLYAYLTMVIGACYILLAHSFRDSWNSKLVPVLYFFGFIGVESAVFVQYNNVTSWGSQHSMWPVVFSLGLIFIFYLFLNFSLKNVFLTLLTIMNGIAFIYVLVEALIGGSYSFDTDIYMYLTMVIGLVYMLLSYSFRDGPNSKLVEILNFFGITGLLGAAFSQIYGSLPWQLSFLVLVIGGFVFSIYAKIRAILVISTLFLLAHVSYITSEYFADSLGWPISLVILGFIFIGLGYLSININKKYIKDRELQNSF